MSCHSICKTNKNSHADKFFLIGSMINSIHHVSYSHGHNHTKELGQCPFKVVNVLDYGVWWILFNAHQNFPDGLGSTTMNTTMTRVHNKQRLKFHSSDYQNSRAFSFKSHRVLPIRVQASKVKNVQYTWLLTYLRNRVLMHFFITMDTSWESLFAAQSEPLESVWGSDAGGHSLVLFFILGMQS